MLYIPRSLTSWAMVKLQLSSGHWKTGSAGRDDISIKGEEEEGPLQEEGDVARGSADWTEEEVVCSCSCSSSPSEVMRISSRLSIFRGMRLSYSFSYFCAGNGSHSVNWISYRLSSVSSETTVQNCGSGFTEAGSGTFFGSGFNPYPGFWWPKTVEKKHRRKYFRSFKREHLALQHMKFINFFYVCGSFCPPGYGSGLRIRIRIQGPHWIRIQSGSGSTALQLFILLYKRRLPTRATNLDPVTFNCVLPSIKMQETKILLWM